MFVVLFFVFSNKAFVPVGHGFSQIAFGTVRVGDYERVKGGVGAGVFFVEKEVDSVASGGLEGRVGGEGRSKK